MTIAAGFLYREGLLLCADMQYTSSMRAQASKILPYDYNDGSHSVMVTVGASNYARMGVQLIQRSIAALDSSERTLDKMYLAVVDGIRTLHDDYLYKHPSYASGSVSVQYLVGLWSAHDKALGFYSTEDTAVIQVYGYHCLGSGEYLGHYLLRPRYKRVTHIRQSPKHSELQVRQMAAAALREVKKYDPYCGGDTQSVTLTFSGQMSAVHPILPSSRGRRKRRVAK